MCKNPAPPVSLDPARSGLGVRLSGLSWLGSVRLWPRRPSPSVSLDLTRSGPGAALGRRLISLAFNMASLGIVVSIPACHAGDRGSIPRRGATWRPLGLGTCLWVKVYEPPPPTPLKIHHCTDTVLVKVLSQEMFLGFSHCLEGMVCKERHLQ